MEATTINEIVQQERSEISTVKLIRNNKCTIGFRQRKSRCDLKNKNHRVIYVYLTKAKTTKQITLNTGYAITAQQWDKGRLTHCKNRENIFRRIAELVTIAERNIEHYTAEEIAAMERQDLARKIFEVRKLNRGIETTNRKITSMRVKLTEEEAVQFSNAMKACGLTSREIFFKEFLPLIIFGTIKSDLTTDKTKILAMNQRKEQKKQLKNTQ